jgi:hypothetical protein
MQGSYWGIGVLGYWGIGVLGRQEFDAPTLGVNEA